MANITIRTAEKEAIILAALRDKPTLSYAARRARIGRTALNAWRRDDPAFAARVAEAREEGFDALEDALADRGMKDDTTAAIFMLKSHRREVYGERVDHAHSVTIAFDPGWIALRTALLDALAPYPEALSAVTERLLALGVGDG